MTILPCVKECSPPPSRRSHSEVVRTWSLSAFSCIPPEVAWDDFHPDYFMGQTAGETKFIGKRAMKRYNHMIRSLCFFFFCVGGFWGSRLGDVALVHPSFRPTNEVNEQTGLKTIGGGDYLLRCGEAWFCVWYIFVVGFWRKGRTHLQV